MCSSERPLILRNRIMMGYYDFRPPFYYNVVDDAGLFTCSWFFWFVFVGNLVKFRFRWRRGNLLVGLYQFLMMFLFLHGTCYVYFDNVIYFWLYTFFLFWTERFIHRNNQNRNLYVRKCSTNLYKCHLNLESNVYLNLSEDVWISPYIFYWIFDMLLTYCMESIVENPFRNCI